MGITARVRALGLPLDELVVIGSGILDAYGLRVARDIDLVVTPGLFARLEASGTYDRAARHGEPVLSRDDQEIWLSWESAGVPNFAGLWKDGTTIDGVRFAAPEVVLRYKRRQRRPKDVADIELLEAYLNTNTVQ